MSLAPKLIFSEGDAKILTTETKCVLRSLHQPECNKHSFLNKMQKIVKVNVFSKLYKVNDTCK